MLLLLLMVATLAQTPPADAVGGRAARRAVGNGELSNMLDTYTIVQAQEALGLRDEQYGEFVARLKRLQQTRRRNMQARNQLLQELRRLSQDAGADEATLRSRLKGLEAHDAEAAAELRRAYEALDAMLDARQQARFRILEDRLERQKLDLLMRLRNRAAQPPPQPRR